MGTWLRWQTGPTWSHQWRNCIHSALAIKHVQKTSGRQNLVRAWSRALICPNSFCKTWANHMYAPYVWLRSCCQATIWPIISSPSAPLFPCGSDIGSCTATYYSEYTKSSLINHKPQDCPQLWTLFLVAHTSTCMLMARPSRHEQCLELQIDWNWWNLTNQLQCRAWTYPRVCVCTRFKHLFGLACSLETFSYNGHWYQKLDQLKLINMWQQHQPRSIVLTNLRQDWGQRWSIFGCWIQQAGCMC